jgi:transposase
MQSVVVKVTFLLGAKLTVLNSSDDANEHALPSSGVLLLTVGSAQLRLEGRVDAATVDQVLARLLP